VKPVPGNFNLIKEIEVEDLDTDSIIQSLRKKNLFCVVDVDTKLLGKNNALEIYGPQKGANEKDIDLILSGLINVISILRKKNYTIDEFSLNGAGGGLAAGLNIFLGAKIIPAKDYIRTEFLKFTNSEIPDYLITAEGKFDYQSFEGKATGEIIKNFSSKAKRIFVICGLAEDKIEKRLPDNVEIIQIRNYFNSVDESITNAWLGIKIASEEILNQLSDISLN
jgi:glycerate kinase